jgi:hypothetical protein
MKTILKSIGLLMTLFFLSACESDSEKYYTILSKAANSSITEIETPEGFRFDMDEEAFNQELNLYNTYDDEYYHTFYDKKIGEDVYQCQIQYDFEEGKLCSHGFWIETKRMNDTTTIVGIEDVASIIRYYKELLKNEYKYYDLPKAGISWHKHVWVKDNIVIEIQYRNGNEILPIMIEFENRPVTAKIEEAKRNELEESITPTPTVDIKNSLYDGSVKQVKDYLKYTLRDPDSYESIEWSEVKRKDDGYYVRHKYRARNGFGGYVVANQLFHIDFSGNVADVQDLY